MVSDKPPPAAPLVVPPRDPETPPVYRDVATRNANPWAEGYDSTVHASFDLGFRSVTDITPVAAEALTKVAHDQFAVPAMEATKQAEINREKAVREAEERTKQAMEETKRAQEETRRAQEETKRAHEERIKAEEVSKQAVEITKQAVEKTNRSKEATARAATAQRHQTWRVWPALLLIAFGLWLITKTESPQAKYIMLCILILGGLFGGKPIVDKIADAVSGKKKDDDESTD